MGDFSEGVAWALRDEKCGYLDAKGRVVIPFNFSACGDFSKGLAHAYTHEAVMGYINHQGNWAMPPKFESGWYFNEDITAVRYHGKFGYINQTGKVIIPYRFDTAMPFHGALAAVTLNRSAAYINHHGDVVWQENSAGKSPPAGPVAR